MVVLGFQLAHLLGSALDSVPSWAGFGLVLAAQLVSYGRLAQKVDDVRGDVETQKADLKRHTENGFIHYYGGR